jgi:SAM-dependent methyltransferase
MPIPFTSVALVSTFGQQSQLAKIIVPALHNALAATQPRFADWVLNFAATAPKQLSVTDLKAHYQLKQAEPARLIFALQTYYALTIKFVAAHFLGTPTDSRSVVQGDYFVEQGIRNFCDGDIYDWAEFDLSELSDAAGRFTFSDAPPDALKALYHDLFPRHLRHTLGEYYTPDWLAEHVLNRLGYTGEGRLLDPACGSGTFLAHALRRMKTPLLENIAGIDVNPLACLAARANVLFHTGKPQGEITLPIYRADSILNPPDIGKFDFIAGNPPWVNWETLPPTYREQSKQRWLDYDLFPHKGMDAILGKGKKDLSILLTYASIDAFLRDGGKLGFILTQSVLKTSGAGAGFRKFMISQTPLAVVAVDDLSRIEAFNGASTRAAIIVLQKNAQTQFPVPYLLWHRHGKPIRDDESLEKVEAKIKRIPFVAAPVNTSDSAWLSGRANAIQAVRKLVGKSDYHAHAGLYTGGANAVYWLDVIGREGDLLCVRNIVIGSKRTVKQVETLIEADFVYPLLRGRDVKRWQAQPTAHILMVQDVKKRRGYAEDMLQAHYPRTYTYLAQFEAMLRTRATFKRYFTPDEPFYSMFDVGDYTLAPIKVVWQGFGAKAMQAVVILSVDGKPIMTNQAMHPFIGLHDETEAHYLAACLNSAPFDYAVVSHTQAGGKSFAQPGILKALRLPRYDGTNLVHQQLAILSVQAHQGKPDNRAIAEYAAQVWHLSVQELADVHDSLHDWR